MNKFEEFMAFIAKNHENPQESKSEIGGGLTTSDNKKVDGDLISIVKMILGGFTESRLRNLGQSEIFDRLARNFIKANTKDDLDEFIKHTISLKFANFIARNFR